MSEDHTDQDKFNAILKRLIGSPPVSFLQRDEHGQAAGATHPFRVQAHDFTRRIGHPWSGGLVVGEHPVHRGPCVQDSYARLFR